MRQIWISDDPAGSRVLVLENDHAVEAWALSHTPADLPGSLYRGRLVKLAPALKGAFVDIGGAQPAFLKNPPADLHEGAAILVEITRMAQEGKPPTVKLSPRTDMSAAGETPALLHRPDPLQDIAARLAPAEIYADRAETGRRTGQPYQLHLTGWPAYLQEMWLEAGEATIPLPSGGELLLAKGPALTQIDVNAQTDTHRANKEAAHEIMRQLRLKNLGGLIVIDFIRGHDRADLLSILRAQNPGDPQKPDILGFTRAGLCEIIRPRRLPDLFEQLSACKK